VQAIGAFAVMFYSFIVAAIIALLTRLCEQGATVVTATHDPAVAEVASLRVTLGPDGQPVDELWAGRGATVERQ
jgi:ABC-type glutathione transport system ATPase component